MSLLHMLVEDSLGSFDPFGSLLQRIAGRHFIFNASFKQRSSFLFG